MAASPRRLGAAVFLTACMAIQAQPADASDNVIVDEALLRALTAPSGTEVQPPSLGSGLGVPGRTAPSSQLHIPAPSGSALPPSPRRQPGKQVVQPPKPSAWQFVSLRLSDGSPKTASDRTSPPPRVAPPTPSPMPPVSPTPPSSPAQAAPSAKEPIAPPAVASIGGSAPKPAANTALPSTTSLPPTEVNLTPPTTPPTSNVSINTDPFVLQFDGDATDLLPSERAKLTSLAGNVRDQADLRIQLMAYAEGDPTVRSKARRISLSRARVVRAFLIEEGIESTRIDVRALGDKTDLEPRDRVDVEVVQR